MRRTICLLAALLAVSSLGSDAPKEYDGIAAWDDGLQGSWQLILSETSDWSLTSDGLVTTYRNGTRSIAYPDGICDCAYRADVASRPTQLDIIQMEGEEQGGTRQSIYRVEGRTLWVAEYQKKPGRPQSFEDAGLIIRTYKRVK
jgi:uncharacterized protein (TIGR03067 family)